MESTSVFVFSGFFESREEACLYSEPQWEPQPDDSASDEDYAAWEDRNPTHALRKNIEGYLDEDFIETIDGETRYDYLANHLADSYEIEKIKRTSPGNANILVLVFEDALGGFSLKKQPVSTRELTFCGKYECLI